MEEVKVPLNAINQTIDTIELGSKRVGEIAKRLKNFVKLDEAELQKVNIYDCIEESIGMLELDGKSNLTFVNDVDKDLTINCYSRQMNHVYYNILQNSVESISDFGIIQISSSNNQDSITIEIKDSGEGIADHNIDMIFEPGFTTKSSGVGLGLGLSICYQILRAHHGDIHIESNLEEGTRVCLEIPKDICNHLSADIEK